MRKADSTADDRVERAVLALLLTAEDGDGCPLAELVEQTGERDATLRALERLCAVGLAEVSRDRAAPSRAARRFDELGL